MARYQQKTLPNKADVERYFDKIEPEQKRDDCRAIAKMMEEATGEPATMWGTGIVGCGFIHLEYDSGREAASCLLGFAARKSNIVLYMMGIVGVHDLSGLGKVKTGKGCIYLNRLEDVNTKVLKDLMKKSLQWTKSRKKS